VSVPKGPANGDSDSASPAETQGPTATGREAELEAELTRVNGVYLRLAADFENYRRRRTQEGEEQARYGAAPLLQALLPGLDSLARAVAHIPPDARDGLAEGLRLTLKQLEDALASQGIRRIVSVGAAFDPRLHDAVLAVPAGDAEPGTVVAELSPGYLIHDRVMRPAQVSVAEAGAEPPPTPEGGPGVAPAGDPTDGRAGRSRN